MARPMTRKRFLENLASLEAIGADAVVAQDGVATWSRVGLVHTLTAARSREGAVEWHLAVDDLDLGARLKEDGRFAVSVRPVRADRFFWPNPGDSVDAVALEIRSGALQMRSRHALCSALMAETDIADGETYVWLPRANYSARLAKAFILARKLGRRDLETRVLSKIEALPNSRDNVGRMQAGRQVVNKYLSIFTKETGVDIEVL